MPQKASTKDCIAAIKATAAEGEISDATAKKILADMKARAERRALARNQKVEDAARDIAGEWVAYQKIGRDLQQRNMLLGEKRFGEFMDYARSKKLMGQGVERYLENTWAAWKGLEGKFVDRLWSKLKSEGVWEDFAKGRHAREIYSEMWELSRGAAGNPGVSKNEKALKIAKVYFDLKRELNALKNRHGAFITDAVGHVVIQTHDVRLLRGLGAQGWGRENMDEAFKKWKAQVSLLNIDWERTLDGPEDRDKFLHSFFKNIYTRVFDGNEEVDVDQFRQQGSLASRISSGRVLWFADADSAWNYNETFGIKAFNEAVISDIHNSTRNAALMMHLGPDPKGTLDKGRAQLLKEAEELPDSGKQTDALKRDRIERMFHKLTGLADMADRPAVARWVDNVKAWTLMSKGGGIALSSFSDKAFFQNVMAYHGIKAMDRFTAQLKAFGPMDAEKLQGIAFYANSMIGNIAARWTDDIRPTKALQRGVHWMFDVTGFNLWTRRHRMAAADVMAYTLAKESGLKFNQLSPERLRYFKQYSISEVEWDAWRKAAATVEDIDGDSHRLLTPDLVDQMSDADFDSVSRAQGLTASSANRARVKDEMEAKLRAFFSDFVHEAVPEPGLREGAFRSAAGMRGTFWREVAELAMVFKGFPMTVMLKLAGRERLRMETEGAGRHWLATADKGKLHVAMLIAEATALGYLSMTVKDLLKGRTPKQLMDDEGNVNLPVVLAAMQRGGGLGIYGDFLFSEYDMRMRDFVSAMSGPVFSQLNPVADILTSARKSALEADGPEAESVLYRLERFAEDNTPFMNIFYIKPVLDHMIFYSLREGLSPGVLRRTERSVERQGYQEFFISPTEIQSLEPEERLPYVVEQIMQ